MKDFILLHGALGAAKELEPLARQLESVVKIHVFEFSGHGKTAARESFFIDQFSRELADYIQKNGIEPVIFGYSMGGYVALHMLATSDIKIELLITLGTKFDWNESSSKKEASFLDPERLEQQVPQYAAYLKDLHEENWIEVVKNTKELMLQLGKNPILSEENLSLIKTPVHICRGELDKMVNEEESLWAKSAINEAIYEEFQGMKHPLHQIDPVQLATILKNFL